MNTKQLRQKILDLAIHGKLVPQDPNDEPASVLLERVRAEKERLIKEGKIKRDKKDSTVLRGDDKSHYEQLPDGWERIQLGDVIELFSGQDLTPGRYNDIGIGIPYITGASCIENNRVLINRWTDSPQVHSSSGDLLLTVKGAGVGKMAISHLPDAHIARQIMAIRAYCGIDNKFIGFILSAELSILTSQANGLIPGIRREIVLMHKIALPPLAEQHRIVAAIESAFTAIDEIERNKTDLQSAVATAKSKILSLAIRGKLVPQDPNDEPASMLLERIRAERETLMKTGKIKCGKGESSAVRSCDNSYYDAIPESWAICQLGQICEIARGGSPRPIQDYITSDSNGINWIKIGDTAQGSKYITEAQEKIKPEGLTHSRFVKAGDFLLTNSMSFGRPYILKIDGCIHDGWLVIGDVQKAFTHDFLYYLLSSDWAYQSLSSVAYGSTVKNLKSDTVKAFAVPVPPIPEQKRIVIAIETAFEQLDSIFAKLA